MKEASSFHQTIFDCHPSAPARFDVVSSERRDSRQADGRDGCSWGAERWRTEHRLSAGGEVVVAPRGASPLRVLPAGGLGVGGGSVLWEGGVLRRARCHSGDLQVGYRPGLPSTGPAVPSGPVQAGGAGLGGGDPGICTHQVPAHRDRVRDVKGSSESVGSLKALQCFFCFVLVFNFLIKVSFVVISTRKLFVPSCLFDPILYYLKLCCRFNSSLL